MSVPRPPDWIGEPPGSPPAEPGRRTLVGVVCGGLAIVGAVAVLTLTWQGDGPDDGDRVEALSSTTTTVPPTSRPPTTGRPAPASGGGGDGRDVLCVGDSIMSRVTPFGSLSACGTVDAQAGRTMADAVEALRSHSPYPSTVVVHLGTDAAVAPGDLDAVLDELQSVPTVVLVNIQLDESEPWEAPTNAEIGAAPGRWPNVRVADWKLESSGRPAYFSGDPIHLSQFGAQAYGSLVSEAVSGAAG